PSASQTCRSRTKLVAPTCARQREKCARILARELPQFSGARSRLGKSPSRLVFAEAQAIDFRPELIELDREPLASRDVDAAGACAQRSHVPTIRPELEDLDRAQLGIHDPIEPHPERGI